MKKNNAKVKIILWSFLILILLFILFFNDSGLYYLIKNRNKNEELRSQISILDKEIETKKKIIDSLKNESEIIEKIARERYNYKKPNEKIIIIELK